MTRNLEKVFDEYCRLRGAEFSDPIGRKIARQGFFVGAHAVMGLIQRVPPQIFNQMMKEIIAEAETELAKMRVKPTMKVKASINGEQI